MHTVGLLASALEAAVAAAEQVHAERIERVTFRLVRGGQVTPETVQTMFDALSRDTLADGAMLAFEWQAPTRLCFGCGESYASVVHEGCPLCGADGPIVQDAPELRLTSIDVPERLLAKV